MICFKVAGLQFSMDNKLVQLANQINYIPFRTDLEIPNEDNLFHIETGYITDTYIHSNSSSYINEIGEFEVSVHGHQYDWLLKRAGDDQIYRMLLDIKTKRAIFDFDIIDEYTIRAANDFVRFAFIYTSAFHETILLHASCIRWKNKGIAFIGPSGIGKSTQSLLWLKYMENAKLLNDDQPAVRILNGSPVIFGTPWSGKTICYKQEYADLRVIINLKQEPQNKLRSLGTINLFTQILPACSLMKNDKNSSKRIFKTLAIIANKVRGAQLENKADQEAVQLASRFLLNDFNF